MSLFDIKLRVTFELKKDCFNFYSMKHCGGLKESLKTKKRIDFETFINLYNEYNYTFYCFDNRINCYRYIISDIVSNYNVDTWLLVEVKDSFLKKEILRKYYER